MIDVLSISISLRIALPLATSFCIAAMFRSPEKRLAKIASLSTFAHLGLTLLTIGLWSLRGSVPTEVAFGDLYHNADYHFPLILLLDKTSLVFSSVTSVLGAIIVKYCRYYLHREAGYARFFATIFAFLSGMELLVLSGTLDLLFAGWELVGISSFLLIGFYRDRVNPQRNAFRAYTIYRICDIGLLLGAWLGHLIWHEAQHFSQLVPFTSETLAAVGTGPVLGLSLLVILAASGKSAQFPFCFWVPRAMEGPTPSSAIFYGALSIHAGVFLLIRTAPIWQTLMTTRLLVAILGLSTAFVATLSGRVQSNVKGQVGYASIAQVGIMLVELSIGLTDLVLVHFVGNAFLRCYQLLVSPSVVAHLLRVQAASLPGTRVSDDSLERKLPLRLRSTLYTFAIHEGYLEIIVRAILWNPLQWMGRAVHRYDRGPVRLAGFLATVLVFAFLYLGRGASLESAELVLSFLMIAASLSALAERKDAMRAWNAVGYSAFLAGATVFATAPNSQTDILIYLSGILPAWLLGAIALSILPRVRSAEELKWYQGLSQERPVISLLLFLAVLGLSGFPVTPAFLGEDLLLHHAAGDDFWIAGTVTFTFVVNGISLIRLFSHVCLGPDERASTISQKAPR